MPALNYILPQVRIFQIVTPAANAPGRVLRACAIGPFADLYRYTEASEKALGYLGDYDPLQDTCFDWPEKVAGGTVDEDYTKVYVEKALLKYYTRSTGASPAPATVTNFRNKVNVGINLKDNGVLYPRDTVFNDRDVKVGDGIRVRVTHSGTDYEVMSYITAMEASLTAASVSAPTLGANNKTAKVAASPVVTKVGGPDNCITLTASSAAWNGIKGGNPEDTYTITVIQDSVGGDLTTARLQITSASGAEYVATVAPAADGVAKLVTPLGLSLTFGIDLSSVCEADADADGVSADDLSIGQQWTVAVRMTYTPGTVAAGSNTTYTGSQDTTYIVEITEGGVVGVDSPKFKVTTNTGIDVSGPTSIAATDTNYAVGTKGVTIRFNQTGTHAYCKGDTFEIEVEGAKPGPIKTVSMAHDIPSAVPGATACTIDLYIRDTIELPKERDLSPGVLNWRTSQSQICLESGVEATHPSWTDQGLPLALPLMGGDVFAHYRVWNPTGVGSVGGVFTSADVQLLPGKVTPDNPLKYALSSMLGPAAGTEIKYCSISNPADTQKWIDEGIGPISDRDDVYNIVPLTKDQAVLTAFVNSVNEASGTTEGRWRSLWVNLVGSADYPLQDETTSTDLEILLATIEADPLDNSRYTYLSIPNNNAEFITAGVLAGDIVRINYGVDAFGEPTFTTYSVAEVVSENTLRLSTGPSSPQVLPIKCEVWRNTTPQQEAEQIVTTSMLPYGGNKRIRAVWPDEIGLGGQTVPGYFACALLAAASSGALPNQGLTGATVSGITNVDRTVKRFNKTQLNLMAGSGVWILTKDPLGSVVYTRHAVTAGDYDNIYEREEQTVRNLDSISYRHKDLFNDLIGRANVVPGVTELIRAREEALGQALTGTIISPLLGPQVTRYSVDSVAPDPLQADRYIVQVGIGLPAPVGDISIYLNVG